jgi:hypothetical protein
MANWFVSHTWQNKFSDTIDAVLFFFEQKADAGDVVLWFDIFSAPQHEMQEVSRPPSWWMNTFKSSIERMGNLILVVDKWSKTTRKHDTRHLCSALCYDARAINSTIQMIPAL